MSSLILNIKSKYYIVKKENKQTLTVSLKRMQNLGDSHFSVVLISPA